MQSMGFSPFILFVVAPVLFQLYKIRMHLFMRTGNDPILHLLVLAQMLRMMYTLSVIRNVHTETEIAKWMK